MNLTVDCRCTVTLQMTTERALKASAYGQEFRRSPRFFSLSFRGQCLLDCLWNLWLTLFSESLVTYVSFSSRPVEWQWVLSSLA